MIITKEKRKNIDISIQRNATQFIRDWLRLLAAWPWPAWCSALRSGPLPGNCSRLNDLPGLLCRRAVRGAYEARPEGRCPWSAARRCLQRRYCTDFRSDFRTDWCRAFCERWRLRTSSSPLQTLRKLRLRRLWQRSAVHRLNV